jgi:hypothetical protein
MAPGSPPCAAASVASIGRKGPLARLPPGGYRTISRPSDPAGRNGWNSAGKQLHPIDACAVEQHLPPQCAYGERAPARLPATGDDGPAQPRARRASLATASASDSKEEDSDSRGSQLRASTEIAQSSSETRASSTPRAAASGVPPTGLQCPKGQCSPPSAYPARNPAHRILPRRRSVDD